jgi:hypothetical protein
MKVEFDKSFSKAIDVNSENISSIYFRKRTV